MATEPKEKSTSPITIEPQKLYTDDDRVDEISLVDLCLILIEKKIIFFSAVITAMIFGIIYTYNPSDIYIYKTDIVIGTNDENIPLQTPTDSLSELVNSIIPLVSNLNPASNLNVTAILPKNSKNLLLTSIGTKEQADDIIALHQQLVSRMAVSHRNKIKHLHEYYSEELLAIESQLEKLENEHKTEANTNIQVTEQTIKLGENIRSIKINIARITNTRSIHGTISSLNKPSGAKWYKLVAILVFAIFVGILAVFVIEFVHKVCKSLSNQGI